MAVRCSLGRMVFTLVGTIGSLMVAAPAAHAQSFPIQGSVSWASFGLGACGVTSSDSDLVVAVSPGQSGLFTRETLAGGADILFCPDFAWMGANRVRG